MSLTLCYKGAMRRSSFFTASGFLLLALACNRRPAPDPAYLADLEKERAGRVKALTSENGWLSLVGLFWLKPGENSFGSDPANPILLSAPQIPARAGVFELRSDGTIVLRAESGAPVAVNGAAPADAPLATDRTGKPDVVTVGRLRLAVIARGDQYAIRVRDSESPARTGFKGINYFPVDPRLRVEATFDPYATPKEVEVPAAQGPAQKMAGPGILRFTIDGKAYSLEPFVESPGEKSFFIVFSDATAGKETYGAGRFLDAPMPKAGESKTFLDFNLARNPPCAFTPFATCPLPLPQNVLPVRIEAGEETPAGH
jgi:uncharacterized protein (DUF1684 family)